MIMTPPTLHVGILTINHILDDKDRRYQGMPAERTRSIGGERRNGLAFQRGTECHQEYTSRS